MCIHFFASDYILSYFTNPVHCIEKINRNMTFVRRKHQRLFILIVILTISFLFINWLSDNVLAGEILKIVAPSFYKWQQKGSRIAWFERIAKEKDVPLHVASGWSYLSEDQFNSMFKIYIMKNSNKWNQKSFCFIDPIKFRFVLHLKMTVST